MSTDNDNQAKKYLTEAIQFSESNKFGDAYRKFAAAVGYNPNYDEAYFEWGKALLKDSKQEEAICKFIEAFNADLIQIPQMLKDLQSLQDLRLNSKSINDFQAEINKIDEQKHKNIKEQSCAQLQFLITQQAKKYFDHATKLFIEDKIELAFQEFAAAVDCNPNYDEAYLKWGKALITIGKQEEAIRKFIKVLEVKPLQITSILKSCRTLRDLIWDETFSSKFQQAIDESEEIDKINKVEIYYQWGILLSQLKSSEKSIEKQKKSIDLSIDLNHDTKKNWESWSREIARINFPDKYVQEYEHALDKYKKDVDTYTAWANLFRCQSRFEKAKELYEKAHKKNPNHEEIHEWLIYCLLKIHAVSQVQEEAEKLLNNSPENEKIYNGMVFAANLDRDFDEAIRIAEGAPSGETDRWRIEINWARAIYESKQNDKDDKAIEKYEILLKNISTKELDKRIQEDSSTILPAIAFQPSELTSQQKQAQIYYFYGNLLLDLKRYEEAGEKFDKAIKLDSDCVYAHHNLASILFEIQGQYDDAKWNKAIEVYEQRINTALERAVNEGKEVDSHEFYYYAQILQSIKEDIVKAEDILKKGKAFNPEDTLILSGLASLEWEKKGNYFNDAKEKSACHWRAMGYFQQAENLLKKRLNRFEIYDDLIELANLYFIVDEYEKSREYYLKARDKNEGAALSYAKLGIIQSRLKKPKAAIPLLEKSLTINPDELDVKSSLAEAYLRVEKLEEADKYYREVLDIAPNHVQSLIGLGETCTAWGDKKETDRYSEAISFFEKVLEVAEKKEMRSKYLTTSEKAKVNYLLGYTFVQRYENSKSYRQDSDLTEAKKKFKICKELNPSYQKAIRAFDKLEKRLSKTSPQRIAESYGPVLIFGLSLLLLIGVQITFYNSSFSNRPYWSISESSMKSLEKNIESLDLKSSDLKPLKNQHFNSPDDPVVLLISDKKIDETKMVRIKDLIKNSTTKNSGDSIINATSYSVLTFGLLMFMVAGLYLPQVLKLSVAGISLEKSTLDQSQAGGSMGIAK